MTTLSLGNIRISWLHGGDFELDGGTMYGAVPKVLWQDRYPPDRENYIRMLNAPLLVQMDGCNLVIDTGLGNKLSKKQQNIFRVTRPWAIPDDLERFDLRRSDIDYVILTHGDFDHAGGVVMLDQEGEPELTFPAATHIIQESEWHDITHPNRRASHTYFPENFAGLDLSGKLSLVRGDTEVVSGIQVRLTGGHTRGHQLVEIQGSDGCAVHLGDVLPTHTHTNPLWIMAYDNFPLDIIEQKERLLPHYQQQNCWFTLYHDAFMKACRLDARGRVTEQLS